jgi:hypothetical protein
MTALAWVVGYTVAAVLAWMALVSIARRCGRPR